MPQDLGSEYRGRAFSSAVDRQRRAVAVAAGGGGGDGGADRGCGGGDGGGDGGGSGGGADRGCCGGAGGDGGGSGGGGDEAPLSASAAAEMVANKHLRTARPAGLNGETRPARRSIWRQLTGAGSGADPSRVGAERHRTAKTGEEPETS